MAGSLNIRQVIALMQNAELFIGNDSGPMHLAAVAGLKGVVLFGPSDPLRWAYQIHKVMFKPEKCSPCPQIAFKKKCAKGYITCQALEAITPIDVIEEYKKCLIAI
jgi:heptosyltransferase I